MSEKKEIEHYTWADKIAAELRSRRVKVHVVHGMWTPSGYFHIGNARPELLTPALAFNAIKDAGLPARFNFFVDDFDDLDKIPADIKVPEGFEENLGKPLYEVPSPEKGYKSWADYFTSEIRAVMENYGIKPEWHSSYEEYKKGAYDNAIRIVLNNWQKARDIWVKITKTDKPKNWIPVMPMCENCGKYSTTVALEWDHEKLKYACSQDRPYAQACRYEGEMVVEKGNVKLPWRLHWPATWFTFGTTFESGGKDHFSKTGSVDTGRAFAKEIFGFEPPVLIGTDFVDIDGKKISGSAGNVVSMKQWLEFSEPELLRFLYVSYQPQTVIDIDVRSQKFFLLTDRYDEAERAYYGMPSMTEKRTAQLKRQYQLAQISKPAAEVPVQLSYSSAATIVQIMPGRSVRNIADLLKKMGTIKKELDDYDFERLEKRLALAKSWVEKYAPDDMRIKVNTEAPAFAATLNEDEKKAVRKLSRELDKDYDESELQSRIYDIARENNVEPKRFFQLLYQLLVNSDSGPRLGYFMLALGKERVRKVFDGI